MTNIYNPDNFAGRVEFAAKYISSGAETNRRFDGCFEMNDGDAVALAILQRVMKRPNTKLAANIWQYLSRESVEPLAIKYAGVDPAVLSKQLRNVADREFAVA